MLRVGRGLTEFDGEFKFAKIQNSHVWWGGGLTEFDAEFQFAKSPNSYVGGGLAEINAHFNFAKIQNSHVRWGEGGGWWNQFSTFDAESKFAKKKIFFAKIFLSFRAKIGTVLFWTLSTKWLANHK